MSEALKILKDTELVRGGSGAGSGSPVKASSLAGKNLLLYFSAHWCPPCRRFTPALAKLYTKLQAEGKHDLECVFVSLDNDESQFDEYLGEMPWLAVPYALNDERRDIAQKYKARGIPHLVVCDADGSIITEDGTEAVQLDEDGAKFPWRPPSFSDVWPSSFLKVNDAGEEVTVPSSEIKDKHIMLYFSAHWCPPCRRFTPILSAAYTEMRKKVGSDKFELIFVSSDRDQSQYDEYRGEMSFPALAFADREAKNGLAKRFDVQGIPKLIMLSPADDEGNRTLVNDNVRGFIESGDFSEFPFPKRNYGDLEESGGETINDERCLIVFHENGDDDEQDEAKEAVKGAAEALKGDKASEETNFYWSLQAGGVGTKVREVIKMSGVGDDALAVLLDVPDGGGFYVMEGGKDATEADHLVEFVRNPGTRKQM